MPTKGFDAILGTGDPDDPEPRGTTDDARVLRRLLVEATARETELKARNAALWQVAEAAISFIGVDQAMMNDPSNPMQRQAWHTTLVRLQAAVKAYQEATK